MINEESLKQAFSTIKSDIFALGSELGQIKQEVAELKTALSCLDRALNNFRVEQIDIFGLKEEVKEPQEKQRELREKAAFSGILPNKMGIPTDIQQIPAKTAIPTDNPTDDFAFQHPITPNIITSIGNGGVPTDRQTDRQTDRHSDFSHFSVRGKQQKSQIKPLKEHIQDATEILNGLDAIKKEIRIKFKQMTNQEMLVFSAIYQLEEQFNVGVEYRIIAQKLGLSESSIRDYAQKLINKGIPLEKIKLNNKKILLKISPELKQVASLQTIMQLREI